MERENLDILIHGLETCLDGNCDDKCPYSEIYGCRPALMRDALEVLKEREPIKPEKGYSGSGVTWWNICGNCKTAINPNDKFCHECGRAVKWD